ncbi:hypothetical protein JAB2_54120 [Janthinobacterium sp. HH100]|nr:hypothetical protein JAB2_54120 [Janthinobacterium sp. HH100]
MRTAIVMRFGDAKAVQADAPARQRGTAQGSHLAQVCIRLARRGAVKLVVWLATVLHGVEARRARPGDENALVAALAGDLLEAVDAQHQLAAPDGFIRSRFLGQLGYAELLAVFVLHQGGGQRRRVAPVLRQARQHGVVAGVGFAAVFHIAQADIAGLEGALDPLAQLAAPPAGVHQAGDGVGHRVELGQLDAIRGAFVFHDLQGVLVGHGHPQHFGDARGSALSSGHDVGIALRQVDAGRHVLVGKFAHKAGGDGFIDFVPGRPGHFCHGGRDDAVAPFERDTGQLGRELGGAQEGFVALRGRQQDLFRLHSTVFRTHG